MEVIKGDRAGQAGGDELEKSFEEAPKEVGGTRGGDLRA